MISAFMNRVSWLALIWIKQTSPIIHLHTTKNHSQQIHRMCKYCKWTTTKLTNDQNWYEEKKYADYAIFACDLVSIMCVNAVCEQCSQWALVRFDFHLFSSVRLYLTDLRFHLSIVVSFLVCPPLARACYVLGSRTHTHAPLPMSVSYLSFVWFYVRYVLVYVYCVWGIFIELIMLITSDKMIEAYFQFNILIQQVTLAALKYKTKIWNKTRCNGRAFLCWMNCIKWTNRTEQTTKQI